MRLGAEYVEAALAAQGRKLMVMESSEVKDDLVEDMIDVLTWFCARTYGRRSARNKAKKQCRSGSNKSLCFPQLREPHRRLCVSRRRVLPDITWCDPARESFPTAVRETWWHKIAISQEWRRIFDFNGRGNP